VPVVFEHTLMPPSGVGFIPIPSVTLNAVFATSAELIATTAILPGPPGGTFTLWHFLVPSGPWVQVGTQVSGNFVDTGLTPGTTYNYRVNTTTNESPPRNSAFSAILSVLTLPAAPTWNEVPTAVSSSEIDMSWNAVNSATGYELYRNGSPYINVGTSLVYHDTGLPASTTFTYQVAAYNGPFPGNSGQGALSISESATTESSSTITLLNYIKGFMGITGKKLSGQYCDFYAGSGGGTYGNILDQFTPATGATPVNITITDINSGPTGLCPAMVNYQLNTGNSAGAGTYAQSLAVCQGVQSSGKILNCMYSPVSPVTGGYTGANGEFPGVITSGNSIYNTYMAGVTTYGTALANLTKQFILRPLAENNANYYWWGYNYSSGGPTLAQFLTLWNQTMAGLAAAMNAAVPGSWDKLVLVNWCQNYGNNYNGGYSGGSANYCGPSNIAVPSGTYAPDICSIDYYFFDDQGTLPLVGSGLTQMQSLGIPFCLGEAGFNGGTPPATNSEDLSLISTMMSSSAMANSFGFSVWAQTFALQDQKNALACLQNSVTSALVPAYT